MQVNGNTRCRIGIGDGVRAAPADHRGIGGVDHDGVIAVIAVERGIGRRAADNDVAIGRADCVLDADVGIPVTARLRLQVDRHPNRRAGIGHGVRAGTTDHRGVGGVDHDSIIAVIAIKRGVGAGAADDDVTIGRTDHILDTDIGIAVAAGARLQVDGDARCRIGIGNGVVPCAADHRNIGTVDHDDIVAIAAIQNRSAGR